MAPQARDEPRLAEWKLAECCCKATAKARSLPQSAHSPIRCCSRATSVERSDGRVVALVVERAAFLRPDERSADDRPRDAPEFQPQRRVTSHIGGQRAWNARCEAQRRHRRMMPHLLAGATHRAR